jgi:hypothetical protein
MMKGRIVLFLFALPFFGVGAWMGYAVATDLAAAREMQGWTPVQATVTQAGVETHTGDDSDTYEAYGQFTYHWDGRIYYGDRISLSGGADNIGAYQQDLGGRLRSAMQRGETVTAWVNPDAPTESVIDREVRWGLIGFKSIFLFVFGGAGLAMIVWSIRAPREKDAADPRFADAPWLANDAWQSPVVRSGSKSAMWFAWGFALFWNLVSSPLPFVIHRELVENDNKLALIGVVFPIVGMGLLYWAITRTLEWRRFGPAPLTLDPFPGSIGGHVGGTIDVRLPFDPGTRFSLTLTCLHSYLSGSGEDRRRSEKAHWQDVQVAHATGGPDGTRLSFRFDVPEDLHESDATQEEDAYYLWRINLKAALSGTDIDRDYEIPVYRTARQSSQLSGYSIDAAKSAQREIDLDAVRDLVRVSHDMNGKRIFYPMGRHLWSGLIGLLIGSVFAIAGWFLIVHEAHWFMGSIFGLVGSLVAFSGFYAMFNSLEVIQSGGAIRTIRRVLGLPVSRKAMNLSEFVRFRRKSTMQSRSGNRHVMYYTLSAIGRNGPTLVLGEGFRGASQADAAAEFLAAELGLSPQAPADEAGHAFEDLDILAAD